MDRMVLVSCGSAPEGRPRGLRRFQTRDDREIAMKQLLCACVVVVLASAGAAFAQGAKRPLSLDDLGKLKDVRDPQCAPDGKSVAFVVHQIDVIDDKPGASHIWTIGIDG